MDDAEPGRALRTSPDAPPGRAPVPVPPHPKLDASAPFPRSASPPRPSPPALPEPVPVVVLKLLQDQPAEGDGDLESPADDRLVETPDAASPAGDGLVEVPDAASPADDGVVETADPASPAGDRLVETADRASPAGDRLVETADPVSPGDDGLVESADPAPGSESPAPGESPISSDEVPGASGDAQPSQDGSDTRMRNGSPGSRPAGAEPSGTRPSVGGRRRPPSRWPAAGAILGSLLLLAAALVVARRDDQKAALRSTTSTTADATTLPEATTVPAATDAPVATVEPVPVPDGAGTVPDVVPTTTPRSATGSGVLFPTLATVGLQPVDANAVIQRGELPLRNSGRGPLTYGTRPSFAGLSVDKPTGTIGPDDTVVLAVTLDGSKAREGPFTATLSFDGSGGTKDVSVVTTVGRRPIIKDDAGESCTSKAASCSRLIQLVPVTNPDPIPSLCNTPWRYSVTVEDESQLKSVHADANLAGRSAALKKDGATRGTSGRWQSDVFPPLPGSARLNVTIKAVDDFDSFSTRTEAIIC